MHMDNRMDTRRRRDGSIDIEFYVMRAKRLRAQALVEFFHAIRRHVLIAFQSLRKWFSLLVLGSVAATAVASQLRAGGDRIIFPERYAEDVIPGPPRKIAAILHNQPGGASANPRRLSRASGVGRRPRNAV